MNTQLLKKLYEIYSPSGQEKKMIRFLKAYISNLSKDIQINKDSYGNLYITKGESDTYPCLVSHLDQVSHCHHSKDFKAIETEDIIMGYSLSKKRAENLGADDKNGVFICLECLAKYDILKVAFFREEEIGCRGSMHADMAFFDNVRFVVQPDRRGNSDLIISIGYSDMCSAQFISDVNPEKWGYNETDGMMTDIEALKENGLNVSCVNVSCGYYNPHSDDEVTVKADLQKCLDFVQHIIEDCKEVYPHTSYCCGYGRYNYLDDSMYDELYDFLYYNPDISFKEFWASINGMYHINRNEARMVYEEIITNVMIAKEDEEEDMIPTPFKDLKWD